MHTEDSLENIPVDYLEQVERMVFREFDEAYRRYYQDDLPVHDEVRAYEQALETITLIRKAKEDGSLEELETTGEEALDVLDDIDHEDDIPIFEDR